MRSAANSKRLCFGRHMAKSANSQILRSATLKASSFRATSEWILLPSERYLSVNIPTSEISVLWFSLPMCRFLLSCKKLWNGNSWFWLFLSPYQITKSTGIEHIGKPNNIAHLCFYFSNFLFNCRTRISFTKEASPRRFSFYLATIHMCLQVPKLLEAVIHLTFDIQWAYDVMQRNNEE